MSRIFQTGIPVTEAQRRFYASSGRRIGLMVLVFFLLAGFAVSLFGFYALWQVSRTYSIEYSNIDRHFRFGSIGSEQSSGLPVKLLLSLPAAFPEHFKEYKDFRQFGFLYDPAAPDPRLPVGFAKGRRQGVEVAWLNCAACHAGEVKSADGERRIISGMPANRLKLREFFLALFDMAADRRFNPDELLPKIEEVSGKLSTIERFAFRYLAIPTVQQELIDRRSRLGKLFGSQPDWGPGRVDTFSAYKLIHLDWPLSALKKQERVGAADFPSIYMQGPREEKQYELHWDGNNKSLQERNLSAALGAGVTEDTVLHHSIERVADWLKALEPPRSPYRPDEALAGDGREIYRIHCQSCHGYASPSGYRFDGEGIGKVVAIDVIKTDRARFDSYTKELAQAQRTFFKDSPKYAFVNFRKTGGYASHPLDGLWLRAPYLHNGSVPTLYHLLLPATERPTSFVRGLIELDQQKAGFRAPIGCVPEEPLETGFCFSTHDKDGNPITGNQNSGHEYGTTLSAQERNTLVEYLKTF